MELDDDVRLIGVVAALGGLPSDTGGIRWIAEILYVEITCFAGAAAVLPPILSRVRIDYFPESALALGPKEQLLPRRISEHARQAHTVLIVADAALTRPVADKSATRPSYTPRDGANGCRIQFDDLGLVVSLLADEWSGLHA